MKKQTRYIKLTVFVLIIISSFSCKKEFLEIAPKGRLLAKTTADYDKLLSNTDLFSLNTNAQVAMGDEIAAIDPYFTGAELRTQRLFRWDDTIYEPDQDATEMTGPTANIYLYNKVINEVLTSTDGTEQEKKSIQAQAMVGRAWTYFLLINYYGKPYNSTTASTDLGFPLIKLAYVTETKFTRASVKEVYDFIVNDLVTAIPNLPAQTTHRVRIAKAAGEGILGKVYMFMGKFNDALPLLNASITDMTNASIPVRLYDYNVTFGPGGSFLPLTVFGPTYPTVPNIEENVYAKQHSNSWTFTNNEFVISPQTVALFKPSDHRLKFYSTMPYPSGTAFPNKMLRRSGPTATQFGVIVPDIYLLRAEVKARLNDLAGAKADVEALRVKRMPAGDAPVPPAVATDQTGLIKFILEERIREFAVQGFRWFDMRRLSVDPQFNSTVGTTHTLYSASGAVSSSFTLKPERLVLRFPEKLMDQNPGMQNNN